MATYRLKATLSDGTELDGGTFEAPTGERGPAGQDGKNGNDGAAGKDGVSVTKVEQTTTSTADGGTNVITVTLSNGETFTFNVKNGSKGSAGSAGKDGSAGTDGKDGNGIKTAVLNADYTLTLTFTDGTTYTTPSIRGAQGAAGKDGTNGNDGTSVTVSKVTESTADGGSNVVTFSDGKTLTVKNGSKGDKGDTGSAGSDGADGERGTGILKVTTAPSSYTTATGGFTPTYRIALSTVLSQSKAAKVLIGDTLAYSYYHYPVGYVNDSYVYLGTRNSIRGATGSAGAAGANGTSVTVTSVSESTEDGGSNVVTFSDGKTLTVKNGNEGYTPQKRVDYFTETDKTEIKSELAAETITQEAGESETAVMSQKAVTDALNVLSKQIAELDALKAEGNTLEEQLAWLDANGDKTKEYLLIDGYYYKCEVHTTEGETVPNFTNILDTATKTFNQRYSSSDALKDANGILALDYIPVKANDVIRFSKASVLNGAASGYQRVKYYNSSKTALYNNDVQAHKVLKITTDSEGVASYVVGYINTTSGNDATNALISGSANIAYTRLNLYLGSAAITEADIADLIMTINEPIEYTTTEGGTEYVWVKSGTSSSADYGEAIDELIETTADHESRIKSLESGSTSGMTVFAPSPQLPADGSTTADFNAETITCQNIYDYIDALVTKYPKYITKETMGKDQSGEFDWNRYTCCRRYYEAWQKQNYPAMYGWVNGTTVIYSKSVSPRIGDTMYSTAYIGTSEGTVTAVSNANQTRTVGGVVYTRDKTKDVAPTLIYSAMMTCEAGNSVYNASKAKVTTISSITSTTLVGADGVTYTRYPLGDRNSQFEKPSVIVIGSNEHGRPLDPAEPAIITARLIKDLCECVNANNPFLNLLKNNYMVVFLPIINPWGYDNTHKSYYNSRGVNLDRNLDTPGWGNDTSNPQGDYGGSEAEMQYFMNTLVESGTKIVMANHALGTQTNSTGEGANSGKCHYMLGRNDSKYTNDLLAIAETMLANYNLFFTDYGEAPPESYAKTRSYIDWIGAKGGAVEMQAREGYVLDGTSQLHTARILEADYTLLLQFLYMLIKDVEGVI